MITRVLNLLLRALPVVMLASLLAGCGQKGPLYLPDRDSPSNAHS